MLPGSSYTSNAPSDRVKLPLPLATAGIGLFLTYVLPGGLTGGQGFLYGLGIGLVIILLRALTAGSVVVKSDVVEVSQVTNIESVSNPSTCPHCGKKIQVTITKPITDE